MSNIIDNIIKDYEKQSNHLSKELFKEEINYYSQKKQMEFIRDDNDNDNYDEEIVNTLSNIKSEKENK